MSILIKTMTNLPEHCYECPCHDGENGHCQAYKEYRFSFDRPFWCPLEKIESKSQESEEAQPKQTDGMTLDETIKCTKEIAEWLTDYKRLLAQQQNMGCWKKVDATGYACSNCNHIFSIVPKDNSIGEYKYCPNCRAKMVELQEERERVEN